MANTALEFINYFSKILRNITYKLSKPALLLSEDYVILAMNRPTMLLHNLDKEPIGEDYTMLCKKLSIKSPIEQYHKISQEPFFNSVNYNADIIEWEIISLADEENKEHFYCLIGENISKTFKLRKIINESLTHLEKITKLIIRRDIKVNNPEKLTEYIDAIVYHYDRIIASLPGLIYWKDLTLHYGGANDNVAKIVGFKSGRELVGKNDYDLQQKLGWPKSVIENFIQEDKKILESEKPILSKEEKSFKTASGSEIFELSNRVPLYDQKSKLVGVLCNTIDITDLKRTQKQLLLAKEKAEEFNKLKSLFISNMEHDIRTPFSGLESAIGVLLGKETDAFKKQMLEHARASIEEFKIIVDNILNFDNERYGKSVLDKPFQLSHIFKSLHRLYRPTADSKHLKFLYEIDSHIPRVLISDEWRIKHILLNLVGNALKFTETGQVSFSAHLVRREERKVLIEFIVKDTGIGIPEDKRDVIFERFVRLEGSNKGRYKGTGLGLANVKEYVEQLGGEFRPIQSEPNKGTAIAILIPMKESLDQLMPFPSDEEPPKEEEIEFFYDLKQKKKHTQPEVKTTKIKQKKQPKAEAIQATTANHPLVLLVEDSPTAQFIGKAVIAGLKCDVDVAGTAEDALKMLDEKQYDLIFADIGLPGMDGIEMTRHIRYEERKNGRHPTPIIGQTANANTENKKAGITAGMQDLLAKPLTQANVSEVLRNYTKQGASGKTESAFVPHEIENTTIIDTESLMAIWPNYKALKDVFNETKKSTFEDIDHFKKAYQKKDWKLFLFLTHKLRGAFIYFAASRAEEAFSHLENYLNGLKGKQPDTEIVESLYRVVITEIDTLFKELIDILTSLKEGDS